MGLRPHPRKNNQNCPLHGRDREQYWGWSCPRQQNAPLRNMAEPALITDMKAADFLYTRGMQRVA